MINIENIFQFIFSYYLDIFFFQEITDSGQFWNFKLFLRIAWYALVSEWQKNLWFTFVVFFLGQSYSYWYYLSCVFRSFLSLILPSPSYSHLLRFIVTNTKTVIFSTIFICWVYVWFSTELLLNRYVKFHTSVIYLTKKTTCNWSNG